MCEDCLLAGASSCLDSEATACLSASGCRPSCSCCPAALTPFVLSLFDPSLGRQVFPGCWVGGLAALLCLVHHNDHSREECVWGRLGPSTLWKCYLFLCNRTWPVINGMSIFLHRFKDFNLNSLNVSTQGSACPSTWAGEINNQYWFLLSFHLSLQTFLLENPNQASLKEPNHQRRVGFRFPLRDRVGGGGVSGWYKLLLPFD